MCVHLKGCPASNCLQCFTDKNGLAGNNFFTADMFAKSIVKDIEEQSAWRKQVFAAREMMKEVTPDLEGTDVKIRMLHGK